MAAPALAVDPAFCQQVRFSGVGWTDIAAATGVAEAVLGSMGYTPEVKLLAPRNVPRLMTAYLALLAVTTKL